jgi:hypothetical protein
MKCKLPFTILSRWDFDVGPTERRRFGPDRDTRPESARAVVRHARDALTDPAWPLRHDFAKMETALHRSSYHPLDALLLKADHR